MPSAYTNIPPAETSPPDAANPSLHDALPVSSADQLLPFHLAMLFAGMPPAIVNGPPAYTSLPVTASARSSGPFAPPLTPQPRTDQFAPSHFAMPLAGAPPAVVK